MTDTRKKMNKGLMCGNEGSWEPRTEETVTEHSFVLLNLEHCECGVY